MSTAITICASLTLIIVVTNGFTNKSELNHNQEERGGLTLTLTHDPLYRHILANMTSTLQLDVPPNSNSNLTDPDQIEIEIPLELAKQKLEPLEIWVAEVAGVDKFEKFAQSQNDGTVQNFDSNSTSSQNFSESEGGPFIELSRLNAYQVEDKLRAFLEHMDTAEQTEYIDENVENVELFEHSPGSEAGSTTDPVTVTIPVYDSCAQLKDKAAIYDQKKWTDVKELLSKMTNESQLAFSNIRQVMEDLEKGLEKLHQLIEPDQDNGQVQPDLIIIKNITKITVTPISNSSEVI